MSFYKMFNILNIEIYTFIGGIGVKGSFEGLYTFLEVAEIYGIDDSCLRKQVARGKFVIGEDVKKMGRDRKSTRLNSSHPSSSRMPSSA